jgi:hypothetical protein
MHTERNRTVRGSQPSRKLPLPWNTDRASGFAWSAVLQALCLRRGKSACACQHPDVPFAKHKICPTARLERLHGTCEQGSKKCFHTGCFKSLAWLRDTRNTLAPLFIVRIAGMRPWICYGVELEIASLGFIPEASAHCFVRSHREWGIKEWQVVRGSL